MKSYSIDGVELSFMDEHLHLMDLADGESLTFSGECRRKVADAIYTELGLGWLPYPENKPQIFEDHYECYEVTIKDWCVTEDRYFVWPAWYKNGIFENGQFGGPINKHVIAYRALPTPYQPESEE